MASNITHKYYLKINNFVVPLESLKLSLPKDSRQSGSMENFLNLSIFTGLFEDADALAATLVSMGLLPKDIDFADPTVSIVKRKGNKETGYHYETVTNDIVYKDAAQFLSEGSIKDFLYRNKNSYAAIYSLLEDYVVNLEKLTGIFTIKVRSLSHELDDCRDDEERKLIESELTRRRNSLSNFERELTNITTLIEAVETFQSEHYVFDRELEIDYIQRLDMFIESETRYAKGVFNNRGLVRLTIKIYDLLCGYSDLNVPYRTNINRTIVAAMLKAIKDAVKNPIDLSFKRKSVESDITTVYEEDDEDEVDPDNYMFLEEDDYNIRGWDPNRILTEEEAVLKYGEAIEDAIEDLKDKKKKVVDQSEKRH